MNSNNTSPTTVIPTAGFIPQKPNKKRTINKKFAIIAAVIAISAVIIVAIAIVIVNLILQSQNETTQPASTPISAPITQPEEPEKPEVAIGTVEYRTLVTKANTILSHGVITTGDERSFSVKVYFTNDKLSDYFSNLSPSHKMSIATTVFQYAGDKTLSSQQVTTLGADSCKLLFNETNCRAKSANIAPDKWKIISEPKATLKRKYEQYFGSVGVTSKRLMATCPYFNYIPEIERYVYRATCPKKNYQYAHFYQYKHKIEADKAYLYFAGGSTTVDAATGKYSLLYRDIDATNLMNDSANGTKYLINSNNFVPFTRYVLQFKKDQNDNYIFQDFTVLN